MTILITLRLHTGCIGSIFITGIFGNFCTERGDFCLPEREFPVALTASLQAFQIKIAVSDTDDTRL